MRMMRCDKQLRERLSPPDYETARWEHRASWGDHGVTAGDAQQRKCDPGARLFHSTELGLPTEDRGKLGKAFKSKIT